MTENSGSSRAAAVQAYYDFGDAFEFTSEQCMLCGAQLEPEPGSYGVHIYVAHGIGRPSPDVRAYYGPSLYEMLRNRGS